MNKSRSSLSVLIPSATVFFSSGCIMILELVASRLTARHLGSSLYTWTSVIGVILVGITIGNYIGGRIADRFPARKTLAVPRVFFREIFGNIGQLTVRPELAKAENP